LQKESGAQPLFDLGGGEWGLVSGEW
jgi:hypothetical protein